MTNYELNQQSQQFDPELNAHLVPDPEWDYYQTYMEIWGLKREVQRTLQTLDKFAEEQASTQSESALSEHLEKLQLKLNLANLSLKNRK